jgi:hypothetical protein
MDFIVLAFEVFFEVEMVRCSNLQGLEKLSSWREGHEKILEEREKFF